MIDTGPLTGWALRRLTNDRMVAYFVPGAELYFNKRRTSPIKGFSDCPTYDDTIMLVRYTVGRPLRVGRAQEVDALRSIN